MNTKARLDRLEQITTPKRAFYFWDDGDGLTPEQEAEAAKARTRGDEVMIFSWEKPNKTPKDRRGPEL
jgi:hypothetical protein